jgi:cytoskeletal protein RodZ
MKMSDKGQNQSAKKEGGSSRLIIIIGALVIVLLLAVIIILLVKKQPEPTVADSSQTSEREVANESRIILDESSAQNVMDEMREKVEEGMFECSMSMDWTFENAETESKDAYVANSENNRHPFYFDIVLNGSDEVLYSSPVLPVGATLTNFKLDKPLEPGTYEALCKYTILQDEESQEPISAANFVITIKILN